MERSDTSDKPAMSDRSDTSGLPALSVAETAVLLDVNERTVRRYIEKGKLAAERVETDRHTIELRVTGAAIANYQGRCGAVEHEAHRVDTPGGHRVRRGRASVRSVRGPARPGVCDQ
jgi:excisionase family DNA binding protein